MGVVPKHRWSYKTDAESNWTKPDLADFTKKSWDELTVDEKKDITAHYAWTPKNPPDRFTDLKLPHHNPKNHAVVWSAVRAAMGALLGARGGVNIPVEDRKKVYNHLAAHYREFGKEPPEFHLAEEEENPNVEIELANSYNIEKQGEVIVAEGTLIYPGTFTPLSGEPVTFTADDIRALVENSEPNIKLYLTHHIREHIGYATKIWLEEEDGEPVVKWRGYVFEQFEKILRDGYYKVSAEISPDMRIVGIAFVPNPAVPEAKAEEVAVVAMENGDNTDSSDVAPQVVINNVASSVPVHNEPVSVEDIEVTVNTSEGFDVVNISTAFSLPALIESIKVQVFGSEEEYKEFMQWRENRLNELVAEVKKLGFKNPEEIIKFAKTDKEKIELLTKIKENLVFSENEDVVSTDVEVNQPEVSVADKAKELCKKLGLDWELVKDKFE